MKTVRWASIWNGFTILVVLGFFLFTALIGGSAGIGYTEAGKYFVGNHGDYTEVSASLWQISVVWEYVFWGVILLNIPITCLLQRCSREDQNVNS